MDSIIWRRKIEPAAHFRFWIALTGMIGLSLLFLTVIHFGFVEYLNYQDYRNNFLKNQLVRTYLEVGQLRKLKQTQMQLADQLHLILSLRAKSFKAVRCLNDLNQLVPTTIILNQLIHDENGLILEGEASSDTDLDRFIQTLTNSTRFSQPMLLGITDKQNSVSNERYFQLKVMQQD